MRCLLSPSLITHWQTLGVRNTWKISFGYIFGPHISMIHFRFCVRKFWTIDECSTYIDVIYHSFGVSDVRHRSRTQSHSLSHTHTHTAANDTEIKHRPMKEANVEDIFAAIRHRFSNGYYGIMNAMSRDFALLLENFSIVARTKQRQYLTVQ